MGLCVLFFCLPPCELPLPFISLLYDVSSFPSLFLYKFQNDVSDRELTALKAVIKCIEEHKLEEQYPVDPLQKRVIQLEKAKADKKRVTEATKPQPKRPRANGVGYAPLMNNNNVADKNFYGRVTDRYPQYMYDRQYMYPTPNDNHCPSLLGSAMYNMSPAAHGNYFGNAYQYQAAAYLH